MYHFYKYLYLLHYYFLYYKTFSKGFLSHHAQRPDSHVGSHREALPGVDSLSGGESSRNPLGPARPPSLPRARVGRRGTTKHVCLRDHGRCLFLGPVSRCHWSRARAGWWTSRTSRSRRVGRSERSCRVGRSESSSRVAGGNSSRILQAFLLADGYLLLLLPQDELAQPLALGEEVRME